MSSITAIVPSPAAERPLRPPASVPGSACQLAEAGPDAPDRAELEAFVRDAYWKTHGARHPVFQPRLLALRQGGRLCAVAGFGPAADGPLFLEQYLDGPAEAGIAGAFAMPVARARVVEIGNFAATSARAGQRLFMQLPHCLVARGYAWCIFTATNAVRDLLLGVGAPIRELCPARQQRVAQGQWGDYYRSDPRVMAARLADALALAPRRRAGSGPL